MNPHSIVRRIHANGLEFAYFERGAVGAPLVLCLHGFPDSAWSFLPLLDALAAQGWRAVAPFQRGYLPSAIPADGDYRPTTLARDAIALIDHLGAQKAVIVGHDWGAAAAYLAAAMRPDRVRAIVTAAVPHLRRFLLRPSAAQLWRSRYMLQFQQPGIETRLMAGGGRELRQLAQRWSPGLEVDSALAPVWASFAERERLSAALGYYRALPAALLSAEFWRLAALPTPVPACVIHGGEDGCIAPEMFSGQEHLFAEGLGEQCIAGAGHFMQLEKPAEFSRVVTDFLAQLA